MPKEQFKREVERELTGQETERWETIYLKLYKSQIPVIEQAIETAALMLGTDKSRGHCLEMICADFLAGANLDYGSPEILLHSMTRFFKFPACTAEASVLRAIESSCTGFDQSVQLSDWTRVATCNCASEYWREIAGDANPAAQGGTYRFAISNFAVGRAEMRIPI